MGHLGDSTPITTVEGEEILLTDSQGQTFKIKASDLAEAMRKVMPVATLKENGVMESTVLKSIYSFTGYINPHETFDTGIDFGGLIMVQNTSAVHDIGVGVMYANGSGKVLSEASRVSFFWGNGELDVSKDGAFESIKIMNNTNELQGFSIRVICSVISLS